MRIPECSRNHECISYTHRLRIFRYFIASFGDICFSIWFYYQTSLFDFGYKTILALLLVLPRLRPYCWFGTDHHYRKFQISSTRYRSIEFLNSSIINPFNVTIIVNPNIKNYRFTCNIHNGNLNKSHLVCFV